MLHFFRFIFQQNGIQWTRMHPESIMRKQTVLQQQTAEYGGKTIEHLVQV